MIAIGYQADPAILPDEVKVKGARAAQAQTAG